MDPSEIGTLGSLRLMKRHCDEAVTVYPIDDNQVTFGCDPSCDVRLYYEDVDALHCKIIFRERKAYLVVLGKSGLVVDNCPVFPAPSNPVFNANGPTTIPLPNNTEFLIHNKRFVFVYPPKSLRSPFTTPPPGRRLRLSMIQSAEVFSPCPSRDPAVNLRILQSPVKPSHGSAVRGQIVLVYGDSPHVVEEDRDLVIMEQVPGSVLQDQAPAQMASQLRTPVRRPPRPSLHRAVLIRSAQRAVFRKEEEEEEREVEECISQVISTSSSEDAGAESEEEDDGKVGGSLGKSLRMSLEAVASLRWPFGSGSAPTEQDKMDEDHDVHRPSTPTPFHQELENDDCDVTLHQDLQAVADDAGAPVLRELLTPPDKPMPISGKYSEGPKRVVVETKWKVKDIILHEDVKTSEECTDVVSPVPKKIMPGTSAQERKAIKERRKSALKMPDMFFGGQAPGLQGSASRRSTLSPQEELFTSLEQKESDTVALLARMKEMLREMKPSVDSQPEEGGAQTNSRAGRRMSLAERLQMSPSKRDAEWGWAVGRAMSKPGADDDAEEVEMKDDCEESGQEAAMPFPVTPSLKKLKELFNDAPMSQSVDSWKLADEAQGSIVEELPYEDTLNGLGTLEPGNVRKMANIPHEALLSVVATGDAPTQGIVASQVSGQDASDKRRGTSERRLAQTEVVTGPPRRARLPRSKKTPAETRPREENNEDASNTTIESDSPVPSSLTPIYGGVPSETLDISKNARRSRSTTTEPATKSLRKRTPPTLLPAEESHESSQPRRSAREGRTRNKSGDTEGSDAAPAVTRSTKSRSKTTAAEPAVVVKEEQKELEQMPPARNRRTAAPRSVKRGASTPNALGDKENEHEERNGNTRRSQSTSVGERGENEKERELEQINEAAPRRGAKGREDISGGVRTRARTRTGGK